KEFLTSSRNLSAGKVCSTCWACIAISLDGTYGPRATSARGAVATAGGTAGDAAGGGIFPGTGSTDGLSVGPGLDLSLQPDEITTRTNAKCHPEAIRPCRIDR